MDDEYDEFQFLAWHAEWAGLPWNEPPAVARVSHDVGGQRISGLRWGTSEPEVVLLHGSGQNAHTWDTFALALGRPCLALDLPGHGRSDWREDGDYLPHATAGAVSSALEALAPESTAMVGMSLGGLTAVRVGHLFPGRVRRLVLVDITPAPAAMPPPGSGAPTDLLSGDGRFPTWKAMLEATHATMPQRSRETLVPGVRHNAKQFDDGTWGWRYDRMRFKTDPRPTLESLWNDLDYLDAPVLLVRGAKSPIVTPEAVTRLLRRPGPVQVEVVPDAGHSVQSDQPVMLAKLVNDFLP